MASHLKEFTLPEAIVLARDTGRQLRCGNGPVPIEAIVKYAERVASEETGRPHFIEVHKVEKTSKLEYRGKLVRGDSEPSRIYLPEDLNECWQRFVVAKEAIHLLVDNDPSRYAKSISAQIDEALEMTWPNTADEELSSEQMAAVVAFEVLYPWAQRKPVAIPPPSMFEVAKAFKIPERHLDVYHRRHYGPLSEQINYGLHDPESVPAADRAKAGPST